MNQTSALKRVRNIAALGFIAGAFLGLHVYAQEDTAVPGEGVQTVPAIARERMAVKDVRFGPPPSERFADKAPEFNTRDSVVDNDRKNEITIWGGYSPASTTVLPFAGSKDARFGIIGLKYSRRFNNNSIYNLKFTAELYPAAGLSILDRGSRRTEYAWGGSPFGVQMNFRPRKKFQPFVGAGGGALYFSHAIPNENGTKFNFTADFSGGVEIRVAERRNLSFGYKLFHISNGGRGRINPSFDNNVFFVGYSFLY